MRSTHRKTTCFLLLAAAVVTSAGCGGGTPTEPAAPVTLSLSMETAHFLLLYTAQDADRMEAFAEALEESYPRISQDLDQPHMARITGRFYPDQTSYTAFTGNGATGSVQGPTVFSVVVPAAQLTTPVHEFVHNVTLHLNSQAYETVWLWEATAVYEAEEFVHPAAVSCLSGGDFPTLAGLGRSGDCNIYRVGYTLAELIVEHWGIATLRDLIRSDGDTQSVLGLSTAQFEAAWQEFIEERYL